MAIDSALKRRNAAGVTFPLSVAVVPDADQDETWRRSAGWGYYLDVVTLLPAQSDILGGSGAVNVLGRSGAVNILGSQ